MPLPGLTYAPACPGAAEITLDTFVGPPYDPNDPPILNDLEFQCYDRLVGTVVEVNISTDSNNDGQIAAGDDPIEEKFPGRHLWPNLDDDNHNQEPDLNDAGPLTGENDLAEVRLVVRPAGLQGTVSLEWGDAVNLWLDAQKSEASPGSWPIDQLPTSVWAEGGQNAASADLTLSALGFEDKARVTVFKVTDLHWERYPTMPLNPPLTECPNNGGKRIFPGKTVERRP